MTVTTMDETKKEAFAERLLQILNGSALAIMLSIGHRTGLFDAMGGMEAATSAEIAARAGLNERYVREWLGSMVTGKIVIYDPESKKYLLPPEHAALLTRAASPENLAVTMQWVAVLSGVEDKIVAKFQEGGGVSYTDFPRFNDVMAEESAQTVALALQNNILPAVPGLIAQLKEGIEVLDVGCGSGRAVMQMAELFPNSHFTGYDFLNDAIDTARRHAAKRGLTNVHFETRDVATLDEANRYDLITAFDAIHDQKSPERVLRGIAQALRPDGVFLMQDIAGTSRVDQDIANPIGPFLYTVSCLHCMSVSLQQGGAGLGAMWGSGLAERMLKDAGFTHVEIKQLPHDIINYYYIVTKK